MIRAAVASDLEALLRIEARAFASDRLSRRALRRAIEHRASNHLIVDEHSGSVRGYALVRFRPRSLRARLYSLATDPEHRRRGLARALLMAAEQAARERGATHLRLEIRKDNAAAARLYDSMGYRRFGSYRDYYQDHMDAWRLEKTLCPANGAGSA